MRAIRAFGALLGAALALGAAAGCGGEEGGPTDMAKLEPPAPTPPGKVASKPSPPPRFGSPPKSKMPQP